MHRVHTDISPSIRKRQQNLLFNLYTHTKRILNAQTSEHERSVSANKVDISDTPTTIRNLDQLPINSLSLCEVVCHRAQNLLGKGILCCNQVVWQHLYLYPCLHHSLYKIISSRFVPSCWQLLLWGEPKVISPSTKGKRCLFPLWIKWSETVGTHQIML